MACGSQVRRIQMKCCLTQTTNTQNSQGRVFAHKLNTIGCNHRTQTRVMANTYGTQDDVFLQNGLADADDENDFDAKLASLKPVWYKIAHGFH